MKNFLLIFRNDGIRAEIKLSPDQLQGIMKQWETWLGGIAAQGKLVDSGNRLSNDGKVVKPGNVVTNGPFAEIKEIIGGYTIIQTDTIDDAVETAMGCPILEIGGSVEVRDIILMNG